MSASSASLRQQAYERVRDLLNTGDLRPGDRLNTLELSRRLRIGRMPLREAITRLVSEGLVKERPGAGAFVPVLSRRELEELYDLRRVLESYAAAEAARHIDESELEQLQECCDHWLLMVRRLRHQEPPVLTGPVRERWLRIDEQFHRVIYAATRNHLLFKTLADLRLMNRTVQLHLTQEGRGLSLSVTAQTYRQHATLLRALRRRSSDEAAALMGEQITHAKQLHLDACPGDEPVPPATPGEAAETQPARVT